MRSTTSPGASRKGAPAVTLSRSTLYEEVTATIIAELEAGRFPWVQPWGKAAAAPGLPRNAVTGRHYSGVNVLILWGAVIADAYPCQNWLTFKQALRAGGSVRKGEKGTTVVYADRFTPNPGDGNQLTGRNGSGTGRERHDEKRDGQSQTRPIPFLKRFTVINVAQCEGLASSLALDPAPLPEREIMPVAEALIKASKADFRIGGDQACYVPSLDIIHVPPQPAFFEPINYYRTALHELTHWAGGAKRLARDQSGRFGSKSYAREELVAELGSAFLCAALSIAPTVRHSDYLANWLDLLRDDLSDDPAVRGTAGPRARAIFRAASAASRAADYLLALRDDADARALSTDGRSVA